MEMENNKTNILDAILAPQEYSQLKYKTPYILDFKKNNQEVLYIGVEHSRDPNAKQYLKIESLFEKFLKQYPLAYGKVFGLRQGLALPY